MAQNKITGGICECNNGEIKLGNLLKFNGFIEHDPNGLVAIAPASYEGDLKSDYDISTLNDVGMVFSLTTETEDFLALPGVSGSVNVHYFDETTDNCETFNTFLGSLELRYNGSSNLTYTEDIIILNFEGKTRLFYKFDIPNETIEIQNPNGVEQEKSLIVPVVAYWVLKKAAAAGVGVALHVGVTVCFERWFGECSTWTEAWNRVEFTYWDLFKAGVEGALGVESIAGATAFGAITGGISYLINTPTDQITLNGFFTGVVEGGIEGFVIGAGTFLVGKIIKIGFDIAVKYFVKLQGRYSEFFELLIKFAQNGKSIKAGEVKSWEKLFKQGDAVSDFLRKDIPTLEWLAKHGDDIPKNVADDLLSNLNGKTIQNAFEDAQGRLVVTVQSSGGTRIVSTIEKTGSGEFKSFKYVNAYNKHGQPGLPPLSANKLTPDFASNPGGSWLYPITGNQKNIVKIKLTGKRTGAGGDYHLANQAAGLPNTTPPSGYTWHHMDDFDPITGESTLQLVKMSEHVKTIPHTGSVKQYENFSNTTYN